MEQAKETVTGSETTPAETPEKTVSIELEYTVATSSLVMRSRTPTIVLASVLTLAQTVAEPCVVPQKDPAKHVVYLEYSFETDLVAVLTDAPPMVHRGILAVAISMLTQSQVMQRIQGLAAKSRIVMPNGARA
ncbi:MAG: hypothetical protein V4510_09605 [bacterium]